MSSTFSPRKTRSQRQKKHNQASDSQASSIDDPRVSAATSRSESRAVEILPSKLTSKLLGLERNDMNLLLRKQDWLKRCTISPTSEDSDAQSRRLVAATLVFGQEEAGTAVCISAEGLLLTCSHCIAESISSLDLERKHALIFASGQVVQAKCIDWDEARDLALLQVIAAQAESNTSFPYVSLAAEPPKKAALLMCVGHPGSEDLEASLPGVKTNYDTLYFSTGRFRGYAEGQDRQDNSDIGALMHDCWTYWGHSGAPLAERKSGELVGLYSSWDEKTGMRRGIGVEALHSFLKNYEHTISLRCSDQSS